MRVPLLGALMLVILIALGSYVAGVISFAAFLHAGARKQYPKPPAGPYDPWEI